MRPDLDFHKGLDTGRIKVLSLVTSTYGGGAERLVLNQMRRYDRDRFDLTVVALRSGQLEDQFRGAGPPYLCLGAPKIPSPAVALFLARTVKSRQIDIVHAHLSEAEIYMPAIKLLCPLSRIVVTKHNENEFKKKPLYGALFGFLSFFPDRIIAVSDSVAAFTTKYEGVPINRVVTLKNGIDVESVLPSKDRDSIRRSLGLAPEDFAVGIFGRLIRQKGHETLIKAAAELKQRPAMKGKLKILVVGDGELGQALEAMAAELQVADTVSFLGFRNDTADLYSAVDCVAMPSLWEGLSLVLLEAMCASKPVISSDIPNNRAVASDEEALFFPVGDHSAMAIALETLRSDPDLGRSMGERARLKVLREYDFETNLRKIETLYMELANR